MKYCKVELIDGRVYDFDKKCNSLILDKGGYTVFVEEKESGDTDDNLMYINKTEIRRIEWVDDSEEVENLSNQESKIEWITDRLPTEEECGENGDNNFLVTYKNKDGESFVYTNTFDIEWGWGWQGFFDYDVIAWVKVTPYIK